MSGTNDDVDTIKEILTYIMEQCAGRSTEELEEILERLQAGQPVMFNVGSV